MRRVRANRSISLLKSFETDAFRNRFPNITKNLALNGYNLPADRVPISPAFHYAIGGIKVDLDSKVAAYDGLYAVGEVASTGVHGANRLASNSLLEGLVFALRASSSILVSERKELLLTCKEVTTYNESSLKLSTDKAKKDKLRAIMWDNVSIVRSKKGLESALSEVETLLKSQVGRLLKLRLLTAKNVIESALKRKTSVGVHYIKGE